MKRISWVLLVVLLLAGCKTPTLSEMDAGRAYWQNPNLKCRYKVAKIAKKMMDRGESFDVVEGIQSGFDRDRWGNIVWKESIHLRIEQDGKVIDPSLSTTVADRFEETDRVSYTPGSLGNIVIIRKVNLLLHEMGEPLYRAD